MTYYKSWLNKEEHKRSESEDRHHILPVSRAGADIEQNKIRLYHSLHMAYHRVFGNGTPIEAISQLMSINKKALTLEFQQDIYKLLQETDKSYYFKNGVWLPTA